MHGSYCARLANVRASLPRTVRGDVTLAEHRAEAAIPAAAGVTRMGRDPTWGLGRAASLARDSTRPALGCFSLGAGAAQKSVPYREATRVRSGRQTLWQLSVHVGREAPRFYLVRVEGPWGLSVNGLRLGMKRCSTA